ncbi:MAG: hypothetical protein NTX25_08785, partial [Proteobacteria bacterium]|nr:hypothetical protein [Pseudomonadota bacterium]
MKKKTKQIILPKTTSKALVIHGCPDQVRAQHLKAYQLQLASLSKANQKMRHYIEIDQPAFTQWWQQKFSDLLTIQVGLEKTFNDLLLLSDAVENYKSHYKCTHQRAYSIVIKAQSNGTLH